MTEEEVVKILGGPGMSSEQKAWARFEFQLPRLSEPEVRFHVWVDSHRFRIWTGRRGYIEIEFDQDNHVYWKNFQGLRWTNGGILDRLRDWLGW